MDLAGVIGPGALAPVAAAAGFQQKQMQQGLLVARGSGQKDWAVLLHQDKDPGFIAGDRGQGVAQRPAPKLPGNDQCPLGCVNNLKQHCNSPVYYEMRPTDGKPRLPGWMNIGAGCCKKKTLGIF